MILTSSKNPNIKYVKRLIEDNRFRRKEGKVVLEGLAEVELALIYGWLINEIYVSGLMEHFEKLVTSDTKIYEVEKSIFETIAFRKTSPNCVAVFNAPPALHVFKDTQKIQRILVLDSIEKPGNLGAILRSAECFGIKHIILTGKNIDKYNPHVLRNSLGAALGMEIIELTNEEAMQYLLDHKFTIYTTFLEGEFAAKEKTLSVTEWKKVIPSALILGNEHNGVSHIWGNRSQNLSIPMVGKLNSLNLSNAAAILLYEWTKKAHQ